MLLKINFTRPIYHPPPSLPWSARTVRASHKSLPVVSSLLFERLDHTTSECRQTISVQVFLVVFHLPPSPTPMNLAVGRLSFCRYGPWSFLCQLVSITVHSRCTCCLTSLLEMWSCQLMLQYVSITPHLKCQQSTLIIFLRGPRFCCI